MWISAFYYIKTMKAGGIYEWERTVGKNNHYNSWRVGQQPIWITVSNAVFTDASHDCRLCVWHDCS